MVAERAGRQAGRQGRETGRETGPRTGSWDHGDMESVLPYLLALLPTVGVAWLFYIIIKNILEGDRRERIALAKWEAERTAEAAGKSADEK